MSGPRDGWQFVPDTWVTPPARHAWREVSNALEGECSVSEERLRFVAHLLDGEAMSEVCREFGVSRKTGYKIFERYKDHGLEALSDRSRRPIRYAKTSCRGRSKV
jgi:transposase-like protein